MDQATANLVAGGIIGAFTALVTSQLNAWYQLRLERKKAKIARDDALSKELRSYIAEVERAMFSIQHSIEWVSWYATQDPKLISEERILQYHQEIHTTFPQLLGSLENCWKNSRKLKEQSRGRLLTWNRRKSQ